MGGSITWFPGHMRKAMNALKTVIKNVDLVLEVRDARAPVSSMNRELNSLLHKKRHIVVLNKADLVPSKAHKASIDFLQRDGLKVVSASCSSTPGVHQVMHAALDWLHRERAQSELSIMMVVGLPNSGKSSLINALKLAAKRQGVLGGEQAYNKRARVGCTPGLTQQVAGFQVSAAPCVYVLDTPGIMVPAVPSDEVGFRLALAGAIKDAVVGEEAIVKWLLQHLGRTLPHSLQALRASGPVGAHAVSRGGKARAGGSGHGSSLTAQEVTAMRACLHKVLTSVQHAAAFDDEPWMDGSEMRQWHPPAQKLMATAGAMHARSFQSSGVDEGSCVDGLAVDGVDVLQRVAAAPDALAGPPWFGDVESAADYDAALAAHRYDQLMGCLGVAASRNPSKQQGALIRLLKAFREGSLGKYLLDNDALPSGHIRGC